MILFQIEVNQGVIKMVKFSLLRCSENVSDGSIRCLTKYYSGYGIKPIMLAVFSGYTINFFAILRGRADCESRRK